MTPPTIIYRHRRENLAKCSLQPLAKKEGFSFLTYPTQCLPKDLSNYILLKVGAPPLSLADQTFGLLLLDATWKLAKVMEKTCPSNLQERSLPPHFCTAYPRRQTDCPDPKKGLASIEALYCAHLILQRPTATLLDHYYWKEEFLRINHLS